MNHNDIAQWAARSVLPTHSIHPSHAPRSVPAIQAFPDQLYVVTVVSNPARYASRYSLYRAFAKHMANSGVILLTVECAFGGRPFEITEAGNPFHVQLRTNDELWHKENMLNIGISRLPAEAKYIATIDADFIFARPDWAQETMQQLQHYHVVQMFTDVHYLGPQGNVLKYNRSFMSRWLSGEQLTMAGKTVRNELVFCNTCSPCSYPQPVNGHGGQPRPVGGGWGAPGGAWAYRREALDALGGLIDYSILGSADYFMAAALLGNLELVLPARYAAGFREMMSVWQDRAERHVRRNVGLVEGSVFHPWHGKFSDRGYNLREQIHYQYGFNPAKDLKKDSQGLWQLHDDGSVRALKLRDEIRAYFRARNEDSIDP